MDVEPQPRRLSFGQVSKRSKASRDLTLRVPKPDEIKITSVTIDDDRFAIERKTGEADGPATYEVRFEGSEDLGRIKGRVRVEFTGSDVSSLDVPLWGEIVGDLRYAKNISFYRQKGAYEPRKVTFTSRTKKPVEILEAKDQDGHLEVKIVKAKGELAELEVTVGAAAQKADKTVSGKLHVKTTDRDEPEVEIVYGIHPSDRIRAMQQRMRKPTLPMPKPTSLAR
ncbi:MAG: hypothetical protein JRI23_17665 [Deltaproteobacteria bacterium]|nr:hypothetical protein [Deltaproteobacteria bacterium]MBW2533659.1 hypothetical protein [Deltaproteobacteria bacterium]